MTILYTTNYGVAYCDSSTALRDVATVTAQAAATIDAALGRGGIAPVDATDLASEAATRAAADTALSGRVTAVEATAWVAPTLNAGYANLTPTATYYPFRYRKINGELELSGTMAGAAAGVFVTLPTGFRPAKTVQIACSSGATGVVQVDVNADGTINQRAASTTGGFLSFCHRIPLS